MSKSLNFYVKNLDIKHDINKLCFNWDCEQCPQSKHNEMFNCLKDEDYTSKTISQSDLWVLIDKNINQLCPLCYWYYDRFDDANLVCIDNRRYNYNYVDPILRSNWCIFNFIPICTKIQKYDYFIHIYKLLFDDINTILGMINNLGTPVKQYDINAYNQTTNIINWAKLWLKNPNKPNYNVEMLVYLQYN